MTSTQQHDVYRKISVGLSGRTATLFIETTRPNMTINPLIWMKWKVRMTGLADFYYSNDAGGNDVAYPDGVRSISARQCWPIARAIDEVTCKINDKNIVRHMPRHYLDPLSRLFISQNHARTQSSGGEFDSGDFATTMPGDYNYVISQTDMDDAFQLVARYAATDATKDAANIVHTAYDGVKDYNEGFFRRCAKLHRKALAAVEDAEFDDAPVDQGPDNGDIEIEFYEPVPIVPFACFPKFMSGNNLSYARRIEVRMTFNPDLLSTAFYGINAGGVTATLIQPEAYIHMTPIDPHARIPTSMPVWTAAVNYITIDRSSDLVNLDGETKWLQYDIAPEATRAYFYIARHDLAPGYPTEHFLGINSIEYKTPNAHQELDARQLYDIYRAEAVSNDLEFEDWRNHKAVCVLDCQKLKLVRRVQIKVKWRNRWKLAKKFTLEHEVTDDNECLYEARLLYSTTTEFYA